MEYYYIDGYAFSSKEEYNLALREQKNVQSINSKIDLGNQENILLVYRKLAGKGLLVTPIGIAYMRKLRSILIDEYHMESTDLPMIRVPQNQSSSASEKPSFSEKELVKQNKKLYSSNRCLKIFIAGLIVIIIGMFAITFFSPNSNYVNTKKNIQNEYSSWEEELKEREKVVSEKEAELGITDSKKSSITD